MAVPENGKMLKTRESHSKNKKSKEETQKQVLLVTQELKIARALAGNDKTIRDRALKSLRRWFENRSKTLPFSEDDFMRVWKGLFYSMWMSDKLLIQEECSENISGLIHSLPIEVALLFFKCGLKTLINEWFGIDQLRLDKFLMLVRRFLRQTLVVLRNNTWKRNYIDEFGNILDLLLNTSSVRQPLGLVLHFTEIYLEELSKVSDSKLRPEAVTDFLKPFVRQLAISDDARLIKHIKKFIFIYLIRQSDLGLEYEEKYQAWKKEGFPGNINSMRKVKISEEEDNDDLENIESDSGKVLDPRAGRVHVDLPEIKFNPKFVENLLMEYKFADGSNLKSRKIVTTLADHFRKMSSGVYPLGVKHLRLKEDSYDTNVRKAVNRLVKFEKKVMGKNKKQKKRKVTEEENAEKGFQVKRRKLKDDNLNEEVNRDELLTEFIRKSEGDFLKSIKKRKTLKYDEDKLEKVVEKKKRKLSTQNIHAKIGKQAEYTFERNSGTWYVFKESEGEANNLKATSNGTVDFLMEEIENGMQKTNGIEKKYMKRLSSTVEQEEKFAPGIALSDSSGIETADLFPKTSWDEPMVEGEYEISVPSKKFVAKLAKQGKKLNTSEQIYRKESQTTTRNKRFSPNSGSFSSGKKVKINTSLNKSQEFHEHHQQILSSPAIPFDANRKPSKPLLKIGTGSPINPFYKRLSK